MGPGRAEERTEGEEAVPAVEGNRYHSNGIHWGTLDLRRESPNAEKPRLTVNQITLVERVKTPHKAVKPLVPRDTEESKDVGLTHSQKNLGNQAGQLATIEWRRGPGATTGPVSLSRYCQGVGLPTKKKLGGRRRATGRHRSTHWKEGTSRGLFISGGI